MKRTVLFGKGELAIKIAKYLNESEKFDLAQVIPSTPEPTWTNSLTNWCLHNGIKVIESGNLDDLPRGEYDFGISVFYSKILNEIQISKFKKIVNLHNSPLPKYRGANPINWALKNGESYHGVTLHELDPGIDTGPILNQVIFKIDPVRDEVEDVYARCLRYGYELFLDSIERIDELMPVEQDESLASIHYRKDFDKLGNRKGFRRENLR